MLDAKTKELIAIGASVACNCQTCVLFHTAKARELNIDSELIKQAVEVGKMVRKGAADQMDKLLSGCSNE
jgi:AhpD family alkylhydroperoxidase